MALLRSKRTPRDTWVLADVAERLMDLREECSLSTSDVARYLGVCQASVIAWERGRIAFDILLLYRLARLYQASPEYILTGHEPRLGSNSPWEKMGPAFGEELWPDKLTPQEERVLVPTAQRTWHTDQQT